MIINHEKKLVFIHIPKCAGKVVRNILCDKDPYGKFWGWDYCEKANSWQDAAHIPLHSLFHRKEWEYIKEYRVIAVVRNPIDRIISSYGEHKRHHKRKASLSNVIKELDPIKLAYDPRYVHFCPQNYYTHYNNECVVDHILHQENLKDELLRLAPELGLENDKLTLIKALPESRSFMNNQDRLKKRDLLRLSELYKEDFELLGFQAPEQSGKVNFIARDMKNKCFKNYPFNGTHKPRPNFLKKLKNRLVGI